jgi:hypothetical protein
MDGSEFDEEITTGKKVMWYRGAVNYEDIHGTPRVTRFRCILDSDLKTTVPRGGKPFNERT